MIHDRYKGISEEVILIYVIIRHILRSQKILVLHYILKKYWSCMIYSKNTALAPHTQKNLLLHHTLKKYWSCTTYSKKYWSCTTYSKKYWSCITYTYIKRCRKGSCTLFLTLYQNQVECCSVIFVHNYLILVLQLEPN